MAKDIKCVFGVDIDAVAGWLGSYGGEDSPSDIQRGMFAGEVGTPRLVTLFRPAADPDQLVHPLGIRSRRSHSRWRRWRPPGMRSARTAIHTRTRSS